MFGRWSEAAVKEVAAKAGMRREVRGDCVRLVKLGQGNPEGFPWQLVPFVIRCSERANFMPK